MSSKTDLARKNRRIITIILTVAVLMVGAAYAFVPLYNLFCSVTGFGGTTQVAEAAPDQIIDRTITVKFSASTALNMPWDFKPSQREVKVKLGEKKLITYEAYNPATEAVTGTAIYNVVPNKAGAYFHKIECFCFGEQVLQSKERVTMPVVFYLDPAIEEDPDLADLKTVTLSYSLFEAESPSLDSALEAFYER